MRKGEETRQRIASVAGDLFRRRGFHAVGVAEVVAASGAPKGSVYFHFREGKEELAEVAVERSGGKLGEAIEAVLVTSPTTADGVQSLCAAMATGLESSGFERGCPLATLALETAATSDRLATACDRGFEQWLGSLARALERDGHAPKDARELAVLVLSALEGALILARAARDTAPIDSAAVRLRPLLEKGPRCDS